MIEIIRCYKRGNSVQYSFDVMKRIFVVFVLIIATIITTSAQSLNCDFIPCDFISDPNTDPLLQCVLVRSMGPNIILNDSGTPKVNLDDTNTTYSWIRTHSYQTYDKEEISSSLLQSMNVQLCSGTDQLKGLRFLYIHPVEYQVPKIGGKGFNKCYLGKFYYYNTTTSYVSKDMRAKRVTGSGNWIVYNESRANKFFEKPHDHIKTMPLASKPPAIDPIANQFLTMVNLPPGYIGVLGPTNMNRQRVVASPNTRQDAVAIVVLGVTSGMARQNIIAVNTTTGNTRILGTVSAFNNRIVNFNYEILANEVLLVMTHPSDFVPNPDTTVGGMIDPIGFRLWGIFCPEKELTRFPDNFCLYGTEAPVIGQDINSLNQVILSN